MLEDHATEANLKLLQREVGIVKHDDFEDAVGVVGVGLGILHLLI